MRPSGYTVSAGQNFDKFTPKAQVSGGVKVRQSVPNDVINELMWGRFNHGDITTMGIIIASYEIFNMNGKRNGEQTPQKKCLEVTNDLVRYSCT